MNIYVCTYIINLRICACNIYAYTYTCMHITYAHILTMIKRGHKCEKRERNGILEALAGGKRRGNNIILL